MSKDFESLWKSSANLQGLCWELKCGLRDQEEILNEIRLWIDGFTSELELMRQPEAQESECLTVEIPAESPVEAAPAECCEAVAAAERDDLITAEMTAESTVFEETQDAVTVTEVIPADIPEILPEPEVIEEPEVTQELEVTQEPVTEAEPEPEVLPETEPQPEPQQEPQPEPQQEPLPEPQPAAVPEPESKPSQPEVMPLDRKLSRKVMADIRKAFTVNDKFLFRRELFGNSAQQYDEAMNLISEMKSYDEARDYFFCQFGWDPENSQVKRFMEILSNHFSS